MRADDLLAPPPRQDPRIRSQPRKYDGMTMWPLSQRGAAGGLHAFKVHISAQRRNPPDVETLHVHEGHDWIYVLTGRLRLVLGADDLTIEAGETVEFSTWTPHWFGAVGGPVEALMIFGPHGERVHLHGVAVERNHA